MTGGLAPPWFHSTLSDLLERRDLSDPQMRQLMTGLLGDQLNDADITGALVARRMKGETAEELAAAAAVMREHCTPLDTGRDDVLDTCGTGGDGLATFNISTATAFVVAAAGVPVVKHGNRAISSLSGSADVLAALGVTTSGGPADARRCLDGANMAFCLAPMYHPAAARAGAVRRRYGMRTLFNALGPLCNPARAPYQLLGVGGREWLDRMACALARVGVKRAALVHAWDGLDEVSLAGPTLVRLVEGDAVSPLEWSPADFGLAAHPLDRLRVESVEGSAAMIRAVLAGEPGPARDVVLANAAAALWVTRRVPGLREGVEMARGAIDSGRARGVLEALARGSRQEA